MNIFRFNLGTRLISRLRLRARIVLLILTFMILAIGVLYALVSFEKAGNNRVFDNAKTEQQTEYGKLATLKGDKLLALSRDYTYWDEMVNFVTTKDPVWASQNLDTAFDTYNVSTIWVYDKNRDIVYFKDPISSSKSDSLEQTLVNKSIFDKLYNDRLTHFFIYQSIGLLEVRAATIHPSADFARKTEPQGYFFTAQLWDETYLKDLDRLANTKTKVVAYNQLEKFNETDRSKGIISFTRNVNNNDGDPVATLDITSESATVKEFNRTTKITIDFFVAMAIVLLTLSYFFLSIAIAKPLRVLSKSLEKDDPQIAGKLLNQRTEFGEIAKLIERSVNQKNIIESAKNKDDALLESIVDGIIYINSEGKVELWNKSVETLSGWQKAEAVGTEFSSAIKLIDGKDKSEKTGLVRESLSSDKITNYDNLLLIGKDQKQTPVKLTTAPVKNQQNGLVGMIIGVYDLTQEKELEKSKEELISLATHELRTPLAGIRGNVKLMLEGFVGSINQEQQDVLSDIESSSERMAKLVNAMLNANRLEFGTIAIEPVPSNIVELADAVISELQGFANQAKLTLEKNYGPDVPASLNIDPSIVSAVFRNLLSNSIKYTPQQGKVILSIEKEKDYVVIKVADNGYGIPKEAQHKIFSKMYRADNVKGKVSEGTGLGLYIVKSAIESSGGKIWFESEENKGSTFYAAIPLSGMVRKEGLKGFS